MRLELQAEKGDTQVLYDGQTVSMYDAASNTLYRYTIPAESRRTADRLGRDRPTTRVPTVAKIEEAISHLKRHADLSGATPTDVAGQPAYTVRVSPKEGGSLIGGAELSFDAVHGVPLRAAIYSSTSPSPVIELAATEISYGPVDDSVFAFTPPAGVKVNEISTSGSQEGSQSGARRALNRPRTQASRRSRRTGMASPRSPWSKARPKRAVSRARATPWKDCPRSTSTARRQASCAPRWARS